MHALSDTDPDDLDQRLLQRCVRRAVTSALRQCSLNPSEMKHVTISLRNLSLVTWCARPHDPYLWLVSTVRCVATDCRQQYLLMGKQRCLRLPVLPV